MVSEICRLCYWTAEERVRGDYLFPDEAIKSHRLRESMTMAAMAQHKKTIKLRKLPI